MENQTYWESLSDKDRRECVNEHKSRTLGDKIGWGYAGILQKKWNEEVYPAISLIINNKTNYEKVFRKTKTKLTRPCALYMVGDGRKTQTSDKPWERAYPTIVTMSSSRQIAEKLYDLLKDSASLKNLNLGFGFMSFEDRALKLTAGDESGSTTSNHETSLCGLPIWTLRLSPDPVSRYRRATIGGVIIIGGVPFVLTAAHVFYPDEWEHEDDDSSTLCGVSVGDVGKMDSSESSEAEYSTSWTHTRILDHLKGADVVVFESPQKAESEHHSLRFDFGSSRPDTVKTLGYLNQLSMSPDLDSVICPELDWALISLNSPGKPNKVKTPAGKVITLSSISSISPTGSVMVIAGSSGVFQTEAPGRVDGIVLPGSLRMQEVWTINSRSRTSCCQFYSLSFTNAEIHQSQETAEHGWLIPNVVASMA